MKKKKSGKRTEEPKNKVKVSVTDNKSAEKNAAESENIPEILAEDICDAILESEAEAASDPDGSCVTDGKVNFKGFMVLLTFGILLYWGLHHFSVIAAGFGTAIRILSPFIIGFAIAFIINAVMVPLERMWLRLFGKSAPFLCKLKRPLCIILSAIIFTGAIFAIIFMLIPELKVTFAAFADKLPGFLEKLEGWLLIASDVLEDFNITLPEINFDVDKIISFLDSFITNKGKQVIDKTVGITTSIFSSVFNAVLAFVFAIYVLAQKEKVGRKTKQILYALLPESKADTTVRIASLTGKTFSKFVTGQLTEAVIIGILCFFGMIIFRIPYAAVVSVLVGATALIPMFGSIIGTAIGAILILSVSFWKALWFVIFIIVLQQLENNLIYPRVVGKSLGLPGILVLSAVTLGGGLFGFAGILLGVPICSVLYSIFNEFIAKRLRDKGSAVLNKTK